MPASSSASHQSEAPSGGAIELSFVGPSATAARLTPRSAVSLRSTSASVSACGEFGSSAAGGGSSASTSASVISCSGTPCSAVPSSIASQPPGWVIGIEESWIELSLIDESWMLLSLIDDSLMLLSMIDESLMLLSFDEAGPPPSDSASSGTSASGIAASPAGTCVLSTLSARLSNEGSAVFVGVGVEVDVMVAVGVSVFVAVAVLVAVRVGVFVDVPVAVLVAVGVGNVVISASTTQSS